MKFKHNAGNKSEDEMESTFAIIVIAIVVVLGLIGTGIYRFVSHLLKG